MSTSITDLIGRVLTSLPGCPRAVAEEYLRLSAIEFCRRTLAWAETMPAKVLIAADFPYAVVPPAGAKVIRVLSVVVDGVAPGLEATTLFDAERSADDWRTATGTPAQFLELPRGTVTVLPLPDGSASFSFTVAYEPEMTATDLPDIIVDAYLTTVISGAIAMLAAIPGKPWASPDMLRLHGEVFNSGLDDAKHDLHLHYSLPVMAVATSPI